jgi:hypothetical protein
MRFPFISRHSHEAMTAILTSRVADLEAERKLLLDRLATIGLGGPLYSVPDIPDGQESEEEPSEEEKAADRLEQMLARLRHRPSRAADVFAAKMAREKRHGSPRVAWIPDLSKINAELDAAEEAGGKQA